MSAASLTSEYLGDGLVVSATDGDARERTNRRLNGWAFEVRKAPHVGGRPVNDSAASVDDHRQRHVMDGLRQLLAVSPRSFIGQGRTNSDLTLAVKRFESDGASMCGGGTHATILTAIADER